MKNLYKSPEDSYCNINVQSECHLIWPPIESPVVVFELNSKVT